MLLLFSRVFVARMVAVLAGLAILIVADTLGLMFLGQSWGAYGALGWSGLASLLITVLVILRLQAARALLLERLKAGQLSSGILYRYIGLAVVVIPAILPGPVSLGLCLFLYIPGMRWLVGRLVLGARSDVRRALVQHLAADHHEAG